ETLVEILAGLAVVFVAGISQGEDGVAGLGQFGCLASAKKLVQFHGIVRRIPFTVSGGDNNDQLFVLQLPYRIVGHVVAAHLDLPLLGTFGKGHSEAFGVAGLGA